MHDFSIEYLRCIKCSSRFEVEVLYRDNEITEGFLECKNCNMLSPIVNGIPIIWDGFANYASQRMTLVERLFQKARHEKMKNFLKSALPSKSRLDDRSKLEEKWVKIYQNSKDSKFYTIVKRELQNISCSDIVLEYGCSIGLMTDMLADNCKEVFGIDRSYEAIRLAKNSKKKNLDYFVVDSLSSIFGDKKFNLVVALNLLELVEPLDFLNNVSHQISHGYFVISSPYDFERGYNSVKNLVDEISLRTNLKNLGFTILQNTANPSYLDWKLKINERCTLDYKVDLVIAKK